MDIDKFYNPFNASQEHVEKLSAVAQGFVAVFNEAFAATVSSYEEIAMTAPSTGEANIYPWLGQLPGMREWVGDRVIQNVTKYKFAIDNRLFELTFGIKRTKIEDDSYGVFKPLVQEHGRLSKTHPEQLVFELLGIPDSAQEAKCFDGRSFFASDHPGKNKDGQETAVSNVTDGAGEPWFLFDCSRPVKPLIFQTRTPYEFAAQVDPSISSHVFMRDEYLFGVRSRANAGFGLWQLAHRSKEPLTVDSLAAAWNAMRTRRGESGKLLGVKPTHLVVPVGLEQVAAEVTAPEVIKELAGGPVAVSNIWANKVKVISSEHLG